MEIRKSHFAAVCLLLIAVASFAAEQESDSLRFDGQQYRLAGDWIWKTPLEMFYLSSGYEMPFFSISDANYRGFTANWEISGSTLYLTGLQLPADSGADPADRRILLEKVFYDRAESGRVKADWFSGVLMAVNGSDVHFFIFENGKLAADAGCVPADFENSFYQDNGILRNRAAGVMYDMYTMYLQNQQFTVSSEFPALSKAERKNTSEYIKAVYEKIMQLRTERKQEEELEKETSARALYTGLDGYADALDRYRIFSGKIGSFNGAGNSLELVLSPKSFPALQCSWYIPADGSAKSAYSWFDFLDAAERTEELIKRQTWLISWLEDMPGRQLRVRIYGNKAFELSEGYYSGCLKAGWGHAGLKGGPFCAVYIDDINRRYRGKLLLGTEDDRAFIMLLYNSPLSGYAPDEFERLIETSGRDWFSVVSVNYNPVQDIPEYLIVDPDGNWFLNRRRQ